MKHMKIIKENFNFLRKPEFWITQIIALILTFWGGFSSGKTYYNVVTVKNNQGLIANTVNFKPQPRQVDQVVIDELNKNIPKNKIVIIDAVQGDQEALSFANKIKKYLESDGWKVDPSSVSQVFYRSSVTGVIFNSVTGVLTVGSNF
jgi:hypothetical protein